MSKPIRKFVDVLPKRKIERKANVKSLKEQKELSLEILKRNRAISIDVVHKVYDKLKSFDLETSKKILQNLNVDLILLIHPSVLNILADFNYSKILLFNQLSKKVVFNLSAAIDKIRNSKLRQNYIDKIANIAFYSPNIVDKLNNMKPSNLRRLFLEFDFISIPKICFIPEKVFESSKTADLKRASVLDYDTMINLNKEVLDKINSLSDECLNNLGKFVLSDYSDSNVMAILLKISNNKSIEKFSKLRPNYLRYIIQFNITNLEYLGRKSIFVLKRLAEYLSARKFSYDQIQNMSFSELTNFTSKLENLEERQVNNGN